MAIKLFQVMSITCLLLSSCISRNSNKISKVAVNEMIEYPGTYICDQKNLILNIKILEPSIVGISISDTAGKTYHITNFLGTSDYQRWFFLIDSFSNVWLESGDLGLCTIQKKNDTTYYMDAYRDRNRKNLPDYIYNKLPDISKRDFR